MCVRLSAKGRDTESHVMCLCPWGICLLVGEMDTDRQHWQRSSQWPHHYYIGYFQGNHRKIKHYPEMSHLPLHNIFQLTIDQSNEALVSPPILSPMPHSSIITSVYKWRSKGAALSKFASRLTVTCWPKPLPSWFPASPGAEVGHGQQEH